MGKGHRITRSKAQKALTEENDQVPASNPISQCPDWSSYQNYYNQPGAGTMAPGYFHPPAAAGPQGHPYMWAPQMISPFGAPPYAVMYPPGTPYSQTPIPPGSHPYGHLQMQPPNGAVSTPVSGVDGPAAEKSIKSKEHKLPLKGSKRSLRNAKMHVEKSQKYSKPSPSCSNSGSSQSESRFGSSSEGCSSNSKSGSGTKDENGRVSDTLTSVKGTPNEFAQACTPVAMKPLMPFWAPPGIPTPATSLNIGMDYWGIPPSSISTRGKFPSPETPVLASSHDVASADPTLKDERELKRQKRKQSNRESARRSRLRKQAEWDEVANRAAALKEENSSLKEELKLFQEKCDKLTVENASLNVKLKELHDEKSFEVGTEAEGFKSGVSDSTNC